jgi:lipopolysaccharide export system protein LptA
LTTLVLNAEQLKVIAEKFDGDEKKGISVFTGNVKIKKGQDELNATKVTVYTNDQRQPEKMVAEGDVSFFVVTDTKDRYTGRSQKAVFLPIEKRYQFYTEVRLRQLNEKKEITGDEVIIDTIKGKAYAKGVRKKPVVMIFDVPDNNETK